MHAVSPTRTPTNQLRPIPRLQILLRGIRQHRPAPQTRTIRSPLTYRLQLGRQREAQKTYRIQVRLLRLANQRGRAADRTLHRTALDEAEQRTRSTSDSNEVYVNYNQFIDA